MKKPRKGEAPASPAMEVPPGGGSYVRQPDGSLVRQSPSPVDTAEPETNTDPAPAGDAAAGVATEA